MTSLAYGLQPDLIEGELLSSYLVRFAARLGITPHRLQGQFGKKFEIWTRDIDRSASDELIAAIAMRNSISRDIVEGMTLRSYENIFSGTAVSRSLSGVGAWITALGIFHRKRRLNGLQYCPKCMNESPCLKRIWRLAFVTVCESHGIVLQDSCPHCGSAVVPHRSRQSVLRCHHCDRFLAAGHVKYVEANPDCMQLQRMLLESATAQSALVGARRIPAPELFLGLSQLIQVAKGKLASRRDLAIDTSARFELSRTAERARCALVLFQLLTDWPQRFIEFAGNFQVSQNNFARCELPEWISDVVATFPARIRSYRMRSQRGKRRPGTAATENWRTVRARTLLRAAGVRK